MGSLSHHLFFPLFVVLAFVWFIPGRAAIAEQLPADATWMADVSLDVQQSVTDEGLGAVQGVVLRGGMIYAYGDLMRAEPRIGVIREYTEGFVATGRVVWLRRGGKPLILHPTGLTWDDRWGTFLGDTVKTADPAKSRALIYRLDWDRAWKDGNLDEAILDVVEDDAAINGCRPEFVTIGGRRLLATADYGDIRPEIRLYDPEALLAARRSSAPGVVIHRVICESFNQNLHWDEKSGHLICVQNVIVGRGWRLDELDLSEPSPMGVPMGPRCGCNERPSPLMTNSKGFGRCRAIKGSSPSLDAATISFGLASRRRTATFTPREELIPMRG